MGRTSLLRLATKILGRLGQRVAEALLVLVSVVVPRSKRLWAFGSWHGVRFADNPKHFFLYCASRKRESVDAVWLTRDHAIVERIRALGFRAYHRSSLKGLWYALRAGVYVFDCRVMDISPIASHGAVKVNLWHGVPLKKIERDITQENNALAQATRGPVWKRALNKLLRPQLTEGYDYVLATSRTTTERFASAFGIAESRTIKAGYPRTDILLSSNDEPRFRTPDEQHIIQRCRELGRDGQKILLYMPTFRDWRNSSERRIPIDWPALDSALTLHGGTLFCKLHPADQSALPDVRYLERIHLISSSVDPYPVLKHVDALITDYSSIFFDYLLLDRPILFYPYDLEEYQAFSRTLYDPYNSVTPGPQARTPEELERLIATLLLEYPRERRQWSEDRQRVRAQAHEFVDDGASARLFSMLCQRLALDTGT